MKTMGRLDPVYSSLLEKLKTEMPAEKREELEDELSQREEVLNSIYHQVTFPFFAPMHHLMQPILVDSRSLPGGCTFCRPARHSRTDDGKGRCFGETISFIVDVKAFHDLT